MILQMKLFHLESMNVVQTLVYVAIICFRFFASKFVHAQFFCGLTLIFYACDFQALWNRNIDFFGLENCLTESIESLGTLVYDQFKFLGVYSTLNLKAMNMPRTANVLVSNLTRTCCFFLKREIFRF